MKGLYDKLLNDELVRYQRICHVLYDENEDYFHHNGFSLYVDQGKRSPSCLKYYLDDDFIILDNMKLNLPPKVKEHIIKTITKKVIKNEI